MFTKEEKIICFQSCVSENTQLCDFLIYYIPNCLQTAPSLFLLSYLTPGYYR